MKILGWQRKAGEGEEKTEVEVSLPDEIKTKLDSAVTKADFDSRLEELRTSLSSITNRFQREDEMRQREELARRQKETQPQGLSREQLEEMMATDPVGAVQRLVKDQSESSNQVLLTVRADNLRRETFEDAEKYPYYTGEMKAEIDKLIENQTLAARNDRSVLEHAYFSTIGKHHRELSEGKLKSRFASGDTGARTSTGKVPGTTETEELRPMTEDDRKAARILGFSETEYQKMLKEEGVGYV